MIEVGYVLAWMGVVLFQAAVHFSISNRRRFDAAGATAKPEVVEAQPRDVKAKFSALSLETPLAIRTDEDEDSEDLEEDELQQLLSQTGKEMMNVSHIYISFCFSQLPVHVPSNTEMRPSFSNRHADLWNLL